MVSYTKAVPRNANVEHDLGDSRRGSPDRPATCAAEGAPEGWTKDGQDVDWQVSYGNQLDQVIVADPGGKDSLTLDEFAQLAPPTTTICTASTTSPAPTARTNTSTSTAQSSQAAPSPSTSRSMPIAQPRTLVVQTPRILVVRVGSPPDLAMGGRLDREGLAELGVCAGSAPSLLTSVVQTRSPNLLDQACGCSLRHQDAPCAIGHLHLDDLLHGIPRERSNSHDFCSLAQRLGGSVALYGVAGCELGVLLEHCAPAVGESDFLGRCGACSGEPRCIRDSARRRKPIGPPSSAAPVRPVSSRTLPLAPSGVFGALQCDVHRRHYIPVHRLEKDPACHRERTLMPHSVRFGAHGSVAKCAHTPMGGRPRTKRARVDRG